MPAALGALRERVGVEHRGAGVRRYQKGQHVICAAPKLIDQHLAAAGSPGLVIDPSKIIWTSYNPDREYEK